ncbi:hypothetical protein P7K49_026045, partial [Saguinus oedipus]
MQLLHRELRWHRRWNWAPPASPRKHFEFALPLHLTQLQPEPLPSQTLCPGGSSQLRGQRGLASGPSAFPWTARPFQTSRGQHDTRPHPLALGARSSDTTPLMPACPRSGAERGQAVGVGPAPLLSTREPHACGSNGGSSSENSQVGTFPGPESSRSAQGVGVVVGTPTATDMSPQRDAPCAATSQTQ